MKFKVVGGMVGFVLPLLVMCLLAPLARSGVWGSGGSPLFLVPALLAAGGVVFHAARSVVLVLLAAALYLFLMTGIGVQDGGWYRG
ncbi:hypothetical protein [Actinomadura macrotermitis]|nr:hypothetical protein [Actinomadura macrotermitis]